jgi:hypothetical protein
LTAEVQWVLNRGIGYPAYLHHMMQRRHALAAQHGLVRDARAS